MLDGVVAGALTAFTPANLLFLFAGTALGIIFGAIPGLTATMGLALLVPFTFSMEPATGLVMLAGIYVGAMYGDAIPAILINTPGTPAAIATTFDGYPLAQKGMAQHALVAAAMASAFGSIFANIVLAGAAEPLAAWSLSFGPAEYFWLGIFGLTVISVLSAGNLLKGFLTATIGLLFSSVGMATLSGDVRLTFGFPELQGGIGLAGALIGFFCLPEILANIIGRGRDSVAGEQVNPSLDVIGSTLVELVKKPVLIIRSSIIGLVVGLAPGAGGNIASMVSYSEAQRWDRKPEEFGKGTIKGVVASEAANSAMAPGSLIPLLTLGIPGSPPSAVILGALLLHGMQPGEELFSVYGNIVYAFIVALAIAALMVGILGTLGSFFFARIVNIPSRSLAPVILVMTVVGTYAIRNNMLDVWVMLGFGVIGLVLAKLSYHPAPLVLGFILGPYIEDGLVQSMMIGGASGNVFGYMTSRPISIVLIGLCAITMSWPLLVAWRNRHSVAADKSTVRRSDGINGQLVIGTTGLALAAFVWFSTSDLSRFGALFVDYSAGALAILSILALAGGVISREKVRVFDSTMERNRILIGLGALTVYLLLIPFAGFLLSSMLFYLAIYLLVADGPHSGPGFIRILTVSGVVIGALFLLFRHLLGVPLPPGLFG